MPNRVAAALSSKKAGCSPKCGTTAYSSSLHPSIKPWPAREFLLCCELGGGAALIWQAKHRTWAAVYRPSCGSPARRATCFFSLPEQQGAGPSLETKVLQSYPGATAELLPQLQCAAQAWQGWDGWPCWDGCSQAPLHVQTRQETVPAAVQTCSHKSTSA